MLAYDASLAALTPTVVAPPSEGGLDQFNVETTPTRRIFRGDITAPVDEEASAQDVCNNVLVGWRQPTST